MENGRPLHSFPGTLEEHYAMTHKRDPHKSSAGNGHISRRSFLTRSAIATGVGLNIFTRNARGNDEPYTIYVNNNGEGNPDNPNYDSNVFPADTLDGIQGFSEELPFLTTRHAFKAVNNGFIDPPTPEEYIQQPAQPVTINVAAGVYTDGISLRPYQKLIGNSKVRRLVPAITGQHIPDPHSEITTLYCSGVHAMEFGAGGLKGPKEIETCHIRFNRRVGLINAEWGQTTLDGCFIEGYQNPEKANKKWWSPVDGRNNMDNTDNLVRHCIIAGMSIGMGVGSASGVRFIGNQFFNNGYAIEIEGGDNLDLRRGGGKNLEEGYDGGNLFIDSKLGPHIINRGSNHLSPILASGCGWTYGSLEDNDVGMLIPPEMIATRLDGLDIYYGEDKSEQRQIDVSNPMTFYPFKDVKVPVGGRAGLAALLVGTGLAGAYMLKEKPIELESPEYKAGSNQA